ncbi:MAG: hypothetical protein JW749_08950 [Sedimentisphaerales bacterium]|nr:hypothetical protein [Sedimentisphaerales bacterium]
MMRKSIIVSLLVVLLSTLVLISSGCSQPGKTYAEVHREHLRDLRVNQLQVSRDFDRAIHFDRPSRLSEMRLP